MDPVVCWDLVRRSLTNLAVQRGVLLMHQVLGLHIPLVAIFLQSLILPVGKID